MSVRRLHETQPEAFAFTADNLAWAEKQIAKFPQGRQASAVIPLLWKAQEQHDGWLPEPAIRAVADLLGMPYIRVLEVATFYTMFNLAPVGRHFVQLCGTTPCMLRGSDGLKEVCRRVIGPEKTVSEDGALSWLEVECLGACCNAPMVQINNDYYEDLTPERFEEILGILRAGGTVTPGPQVDRPFSGPQGGLTSLTDRSIYEPRHAHETASPTRRQDQASEGRGEATAKPDTQPRPEEAAADTPADRAARGEPAIKPAERAAAVKRKSAGPAPQHDTEKAPVLGEGHALKKPETLTAPRDGTGDDLKRIRGLGPRLEVALNAAGIFHYDQIASWSESEIAWIDENVEGARGRAQRDEWVAQATSLSGKGE